MFANSPRVPDLTSSAHINLNQRLTLPCRASRIRWPRRIELARFVTKRPLSPHTDAITDIMSNHERMLVTALRELFELRERVRKAERAAAVKSGKSYRRKPTKRRRR